MEPKVRDLYKRFLLVGRDYPLGLGHVREKVKVAFFQNRDLTDPVAIKKAIKRGRWMVREMVGVIQLKKYRTLNSRYTPEDLREKLRDIENRRVLAEIEQQHEGDDDVVGPSASATNCSMKHSVQCELPKPTTQVVVTLARQPSRKTHPLLARTLQSTGIFVTSVLVLYVSDSVMRQKWVLSKTSADHALLRKSIRRVGSGCKDPRAVATCSGLSRRLQVSVRDACGALPHSTTNATFVNDLVLAVLGRDTQCETMQQTRYVLEDHFTGSSSIGALPAGQDCGDASDDSSECPICCGDLADDITLRLPCGHNYHAGCVRVWLNLQHTCPVCRLQLHEGVISY
ncbi:Zinc finger, RING/FYVE/PHD-type [Phytophthora cactorum]|nr:Zinc finger, RING/FYVE/PHD-type [Phytophthora cactorum]